MEFLSPQYLWLLLGIPPAVLLWALGIRHHRRTRVRFGNLENLKEISRVSWAGRGWLRGGLFATSLAGMILGLAHPQAVGRDLRPVPMPTDVIFMLDTSPSMFASDMDPTRLGRAQQIIQQFILRKLPDDRYALVPFSFSSIVLSYLTRDPQNVLLYFDHLNQTTEPAAGTNIGAAVIAGLRVIEADEQIAPPGAGKRRRVLILISDGDDNIGEWQEPLSEVIRARIKIYTIRTGHCHGGFLSAGANPERGRPQVRHIGDRRTDHCQGAVEDVAGCRGTHGSALLPGRGRSSGASGDRRGAGRRPAGGRLSRRPDRARFVFLFFHRRFFLHDRWNLPMNEETSSNGCPEIDREHAWDVIQKMEEQIRKVVIGQDDLIQKVLIGLFGRISYSFKKGEGAMAGSGHILLEGVPGVAKTLLVSAIAGTFRAKFQRIQFTPDMLPADILGTRIFDSRAAEFRVEKGPIFANIVLADEINRAPQKAQSALLEAMQERQVTIGENTYPLDDPFWVLATQNPVEQEGVFSLPEAELDRFAMMIRVNYPTAAHEVQMLQSRLEEVTINAIARSIDGDPDPGPGRPGACG